MCSKISTRTTKKVNTSKANSRNKLAVLSTLSALVFASAPSLFANSSSDSYLRSQVKSLNETDPTLDDISHRFSPTLFINSSNRTEIVQRGTEYFTKTFYITTENLTSQAIKALLQIAPLVNPFPGWAAPIIIPTDITKAKIVKHYKTLTDAQNATEQKVSPISSELLNWNVGESTSYEVNSKINLGAAAGIPGLAGNSTGSNNGILLHYYIEKLNGQKVLVRVSPGSISDKNRNLIFTLFGYANSDLNININDGTTYILNLKSEDGRNAYDLLISGLVDLKKNEEVSKEDILRVKELSLKISLEHQQAKNSYAASTKDINQVSFSVPKILNVNHTVHSENESKQVKTDSEQYNGQFSHNIENNEVSYVFDDTVQSKNFFGGAYTLSSKNSEAGYFGKFVLRSRSDDMTLNDLLEKVQSIPKDITHAFTYNQQQVDNIKKSVAANGTALNYANIEFSVKFDEAATEKLVEFAESKPEGRYTNDDLKEVVKNASQIIMELKAKIEDSKSAHQSATLSLFQIPDIYSKLGRLALENPNLFNALTTNAGGTLAVEFKITGEKFLPLVCKSTSVELWDKNCQQLDEKFPTDEE